MSHLFEVLHKSIFHHIILGSPIPCNQDPQQEGSSYLPRNWSLVPKPWDIAGSCAFWSLAKLLSYLSREQYLEDHFKVREDDSWSWQVPKNPASGVRKSSCLSHPNLTQCIKSSLKYIPRKYWGESELQNNQKCGNRHQPGENKKGSGVRAFMRPKELELEASAWTKDPECCGW